MTYNARTPKEYLSMLPGDRQAPMKQLRQVILEHLPDGFLETMSYGMIGYVVPHSLYPDGYHCDPKLPLPFLNIASQKNHIALYHMGLYASPELQQWFEAAYMELGTAKPDMGKSCIRFGKPERIPFKLIGELCGKMTVSEWIDLYEGHVRK